MTVGDDILTLALELPPQQRAELARRLLLSLESSDVDADADELWASEIERRAADAERDDSPSIEWRSAIERIRKSLRDEQRL